MWKFSNFADAEVEYGEILYPTLEHAYQAAKTLDAEWREKILNAETPGKAKRLGGKAPMRPGWEQMKVEVMDELLRQKYAEGTEFRKLLDETDGEEIVEWNYWHDNIWGKCTCSNCGSKGHNILGKLLMDIRDGVQREYQYCPTHNHFGVSSCFYCDEESENQDRLQEERMNDEVKKEQERRRLMQLKEREEKDKWTRWFHNG